jgi:hypothetical protein
MREQQTIWALLFSANPMHFFITEQEGCERFQIAVPDL